MAVVEKSMLVHYPAEKMFRLVNDVASYPAFLPWCAGVEILDEDARQMHAALHVDYKGIKQRFSTRNRFTEPAGAQTGSIVMALVEGPFRSLDGYWSFKPLGENACKIEFALHYEFSSKLLERVFGPVFRHIANSFVDAFFRRAEALYASR